MVNGAISAFFLLEAETVCRSSAAIEAAMSMDAEPDAPPGFFDAEDKTNHEDIEAEDVGEDGSGSEADDSFDDGTPQDQKVGEKYLPPEHFRKVIRDHRDITSKDHKQERRLYIGAMKYMPHAILKLLENMPMPWESRREVNVAYHVSGALTVVTDTPRVPPPVFHAQWAAMWVEMRRQKKLRRNFQRVSFPLFDDDEPVVDYEAHILGVETPDPICMALDAEEDDKAIAEWFYSSHNTKPKLPDGCSIHRKKKTATWSLTVPVMSNLLRLSEVLLSDYVDRNYFFLFDREHLAVAKALNVALPGAPRFEPLFLDTDDILDEDWTEFNDLNKVIVRNQTHASEQMIAFPFLYAPDVRGVKTLPPYHDPALVLVKCDDNPEIPAFYYDPVLNPVLNVECPCDDGPPIDFDEDLQLPDDFAPLFDELPLEHPNTKSGIALAWAPQPYDKLSVPLRRPIDIPLIDSWCHEHCPREQPSKVKQSYVHLLKKNVARSLHRTTLPTGSRKRIVEELAATAYFQQTKIDWLEAALSLVLQGHHMLTMVLRKKNLPYVHIDYNFNAKPTKTLTTKERKRSRLGQAFHFVRELLMYVKCIVDVHVKYRLGQIDAFQLADGLHYVFTHSAKLTGMYRYKYRVMRQAKEARDWKRLIYSRFNTGEVKKGPGAGFWEPAWRVWVFFMRGITPWLERCLQNLVTRMYEGRQKHVIKKVSRQRIESDYDINLRTALKQAVLELLPEGSKANKLRRIEQHASEAFRCWKRNVPWKVPGMAPQYEAIIIRFVKEKSDRYVEHTRMVRERICHGDTVDKNVFQKNLGRITRLKLKAEQERQKSYLAQGSAVHPDEGRAILQLAIQWLEARDFKPIDFPQLGHPYEMELLKLALDRLRSQHNIANRLTQEEREEEKRIEDAFDNPQETLSKIREALARHRVFKSVYVEYIDNFASLSPIYKVTTTERIVDAYLDQYLWFEATNRRLFPSWVKPSDMEPLPVLVHKWCEGINNSPGIWDVDNGECTVVAQFHLEEFFEKLDWTLVRHLLELVMHPELVNYIVAKHSVKLEYKDMEHLHHVGLIRGLMFSSFITQYWGLIVDLMLLGSRRSQELAGSPQQPNPFMHFRQKSHAASHPIRGYMRYIDQCHMLLRFTRDEADDLIHRYLQENEETSVLSYKNKRCWPRDCRMRLFKYDVNLGRAVLWDLQNRLPGFVAHITWAHSFVSVYSRDNPNLLFDMAGFDIRILPVCRTSTLESVDTEYMWTLRKDDHTRDLTARAYLQVTQEDVRKIQNRIRRAIMTIGNATFQKIAQKWNSVLLEVVPYYREAILGTEGLQQIFVRGEAKMQRRIMMALNSKMPARFPPVIFHAPTQVGGLGMLSIAGALIPASDRSISKQTDAGVQYFIKGITHEEEDTPLPVLFRYYDPWESEFRESERVWDSFRQLEREAKLSNRRISFDEVEDIVDLGIPRVRTIFAKDRRLLAIDHGFRVRSEFQKYVFGRPPRSTWYNDDHDGRLCGALDNYRKDMIQALGGIEAIIEHTLFRGTGLPSWEDLFFNSGSGFEDKKKYAKLTKAQRAGLVKVPNRRFALWWSPTINRSNVYAGFEAQIDLTGIMMSGKLETIKVAYIELFANHLWEKIHANVVDDLRCVFAKPDTLNELFLHDVKLENVHPKKSFTFTCSCPDIVMLAADRWSVCKPSLLDASHDAFETGLSSTKYWIDVQLRWGDYDKHNVASYARAKFLEYTKDGVSRYPSASGVVVAIDLAYNVFSAYGYWIPGAKELLLKSMNKIMKCNHALLTLRDKLRKMLQVFVSDPTEKHLSSQNFGELFSDQATWIIDDSHVFVTSQHATVEGNRKFKEENGALIIVCPSTGVMLLSVVHKSVFHGQKRRTKLAREKACECVATWLRSLPSTERPQRIVVTRRSLCQTLDHALMDFRNIVVSQSDLNLPISQLLLHDRLGDFVATATHSKEAKFNVFDDWSQILTPHSCFMRLILILRGFHVNLDRTRHVLEPDRHVVRESNHFWPTLSPDEWALCERQLHDMIIQDYARQMNVDEKQLTKKEKVDVILGQVVSNVEAQKEEIDKIEKQTKQLTAPTTVTTVNKLGQEITTQVTATFAAVAWQSASSEWRRRAIEVTSLKNCVDKIFVEPPSGPTDGTTLVLPRSLLENFVLCADTRVCIGGLLFGVPLAEDPTVKEVRAILMPPQSGKSAAVSIPTSVPQHDALQSGGFMALGWIRTQPDSKQGAAVLNSCDVATQGRLLADNPSLSADSFYSVLCSVAPTQCRVRGFACTDDGIQWALDHRDDAEHEPQPLAASLTRPCTLLVSDRVNGFFLVPSQGSWNYAFRGLQWQDAYYAKVDVPNEFFHAAHRPAHVASFSKLGVDSSAVDIADMADQLS